MAVHKTAPEHLHGTVLVLGAGLVSEHKSVPEHVVGAEAGLLHENVFEPEAVLAVDCVPEHVSVP